MGAPPLAAQEEDLRKLAEAGCAAVFMPPTLYNPGGGSAAAAAAAGEAASAGGGADAGMVVGASEEADPEAHETWVTVERLSQGLCAKSRPHFFRGVCTVSGGWWPAGWSRVGTGSEQGRCGFGPRHWPQNPAAPMP